MLQLLLLALHPLFKRAVGLHGCPQIGGLLLNQFVTGFQQPTLMATGLLQLEKFATTSLQHRDQPLFAQRPMLGEGP